jgi:methanogenic corrinoid protein MtbC1
LISQSGSIAAKLTPILGLSNFCLDFRGQVVRKIAGLAGRVRRLSARSGREADRTFRAHDPRLGAALRSGHLAGLTDAAIEERLTPNEERPGVPPPPQLEDALARLDLAEVERTLGLQLSALGPVAFARDFAGPLLRDIGDRWERGEISIAAEHLVSSAARGILAAALRAGSFVAGATPQILLTTPEGEPHEFGVLIAAVTAAAAGAGATYLGPGLPADEVARAAEASGASVVALSVVTLPLGTTRRYLTDLRQRLDASTPIWVGGPAPIDGVPGVDHIDLDEFARRISRLQRLPGAPRV